MQADIASGKLSDRGYVTRYDFKTGEVTALVGQVPCVADKPVSETEKEEDPSLA